ncbi:uncharacterized protein LOC132313533 isoform X2 [Cornus florida]|uniref:uncharacterized protein LOC132313533 isoform X2 n=1 Tax=Cornus florida TaxID=4283 RepID=UPI002896ED83|nr:uncharacterized protein LOC132313533 isoform X2 [Cornus florida]
MDSSNYVAVGEDRNRSTHLEDAQLIALPAGTETDMEIDGDEEEEEGEVNSEDGEFALRFEGDMNPFDFTEDDASGVQPYQRFERLEYDTFAEKKRKVLDSHSEELAKKSRKEDVFGVSFDEIMEAMNYGNRRKSRKSKKRGRPRGNKNKFSPEVTRMLGESTLHYAHGRYAEAIRVLNEVVRLAPNLPDTYHTLGLVYNAVGDKKKAFSFYMLAAAMKPKDSPLWKLLLTWSLEQGNIAQARYCLSKAIMADPEDITLKCHLATLYIELGDYEKAAKLYDQISQLCPGNVEARKAAARLFQSCGQVERSIGILEDYLKHHTTEADLSIVELLAVTCMENNEYAKALQHIELAHTYSSGKELPLQLMTKAGICHLHLGNLEKAQEFFGKFQLENACDHANLITEVADSFKSLAQYEVALSYYLMLEKRVGHDNGILHLKIGQCHLFLNERVQAIRYFYKALDKLEDSVDARLTLASLLQEEGKEDEAVSVLSPTNAELTLDTNCTQTKLWWLNEKVKLKLANIYRAKGMLDEFVDALSPLIHDVMIKIQFRPRKKLSKNVLLERAKVLDDHQTDNLFRGFKPTASASDRLKASRARRMLQKKSTLKEEMKAKALAAGLEWQSEDSDDEPPLRAARRRKSTLPQLLKDEEHHQLIVDLCKALASLRRYGEALDLINLTLRWVSNKLSVERRDELLAVGAQMAYHIMDPKHGCDFVRNIILQRPYSIAAWNCFYKVISSMDVHQSKYSRFLHRMREKHRDCVPPIIISGHQFTMISQHQAAAREYLEALKLLPDSPLINLCVGASLINLALDIRLQNKHQCLVQGLAFLYNNLRLCGNSQEALYNIARACHHVGLVSLAASFYEKVLTTKQKDYPIPKLPYENPDLTENQKPGYCNIQREAAYNLHLIYKRSGAFDLARQVLRDYCTL